MSESAFSLTGAEAFSEWLEDQDLSIAFTTYQVGKLFLLGRTETGELSVFERTFDRCMGLAVSGSRLWMSSKYQIWRFENFLDPGQSHDGFDRVFVPVSGHTTGDVDVHDIAVSPAGTPIFAVTRFNCLATLSELGSFKPIWTPSFVDEIVAEDRCHLNGLAVDDKGAKFVTCIARTNSADGWRDHRKDGGVLLDVASGETVARGLSMPHSPRLHAGRIWLLQAGTGEFGEIDLRTGLFAPVCFLPGFARGLAFVGDYAVIGLSRPRQSEIFHGLPLEHRMEMQGLAASCAISVVSLKTGREVARLEIEGIVQELYDVVLLPGVKRPQLVGFEGDEIRFLVRLT